MRHLHALYNMAVDIILAFIKNVREMIYAYIAMAVGIFVTAYDAIRCDFDWEATGWVDCKDTYTPHPNDDDWGEQVCNWTKPIRITFVEA